jgi:hypothetical protein
MSLEKGFRVATRRTQGDIAISKSGPRAFTE